MIIFSEEYHAFSEPLMQLLIRDQRISARVFQNAPIPACSVMKSRMGSSRSSFSSFLSIPEKRCPLFQCTVDAVLSFFTSHFHCIFTALVSRFQRGAAMVDMMLHRTSGNSTTMGISVDSSKKQGETETLLLTEKGMQ